MTDKAHRPEPDEDTERARMLDAHKHDWTRGDVSLSKKRPSLDEYELSNEDDRN